MLHSHVLANGSIVQDRIRLQPTTPDITEGRWVPADPPVHNPDTQRPDPVTPVAADATQISYTLTAISPPVPRVVSRFKARAALHAAGLFEIVDAIMADPATTELTRMAWDEATEFARDSPTVAAMAAALDLSSDDIDELFRMANKVIA
jgi:hypothetical protein